MASIKQIQLGPSLKYEINAKYIQDESGNEKTWKNIEDLVTAGFTIEVPWTKNDYDSETEPTAQKLATVPAVDVYYNHGATVATGTLAATVADTRKHIYLIYQPKPETALDNFDEYISTGTTWEKIGDTYVDLSDYVRKGWYWTESAGSTAENAGGGTVNTSDSGAQTATGTATVTYKKSATTTSSNHGEANGTTDLGGGFTIHGASLNFIGTPDTIETKVETVSIDNHTFTPAGSIAITPTAADTTVINNVTNITASSPTFYGTKATISISGNVTGTSIAAHSEQTLTATGTQDVESHSHTVGSSKATVTVVTGVDANTNSTGAHIHSVTGKVTADGTIGVGDGTANYTPSGTISTVSAGSHSHPVTTSTASVSFISAVGNAASAGDHTHSVTGNVTASGTISESTGTVNFTPKGTISQISHASHSHTVNLNKETVSYIKTVGAATGENGAHTHDVDSHTHAANVTATKITAYTAPSMTAISFTPNTLQSLTTKNYGFTTSVQNVMYGATVVNNVLSWSSINAGTQDVLSAGAQASLSGGEFSAGTLTYTDVTAAGVGSAKTLTAKSAGAHTHSVTSTGSTFSNVIDATLSENGAFSVTPTFTGTGTRLVFTGSKVALGDGLAESAGAHTHSVGSTSNTFTNITGITTGKAGAFSVGPTFYGTPVELKFAGSQVDLANGLAVEAGAHSHTIGKTTESVTYVSGVSANTGNGGAHTVQGSNFKITIPELTHNVTQGSFSGSTEYTPAGTISAPVINITKTGVTVATEGIKSVTAGFSGTAVTLTHAFTAGSTITLQADYTPEGTIGGEVTVDSHSHGYVKPANHSHGIELTDTTISGSAAVAVSSHTHSVTMASHTHKVSGHTHEIDLTVASHTHQA